MNQNAEILEELRWKKFPVLSDGFVTLVDCMGDDAAIVQAARVSYGAGTKTVSDDETLIRYLMRQQHTSPFEACQLKFMLRIPMDAHRQHVRHRTFGISEYSTRYSEAIDAADTTKSTQWRLQSDNNKQGSSGYLTEWPEAWKTSDPDEFHPPAGPIRANGERSISPSRCQIKTVGDYLTAQEEKLQAYAREIYEERLAAGVAREQARKDLPLSTYTELYWYGNLHNLLHYLKLRMDSHAQLEIRSYADVIGYEIVAKLFPATWRAFCDYRLNSMSLSATDQKCLRVMLDSFKVSDIEPNVNACFLNKREKAEFIAKLRKLGLLED